MDTRFLDYNSVRHGAPAIIYRRAQQLRKTMTLAELRLWHVLKGNRLSGLSFRRQQPIFGFIVDFYCHRLSLVIDIDGAVHEQMANRDLERDAVLTDAGMTILHFRNEQVFQNLPQVLDQILQTAEPLKRKTP